MSKLKMLSNFVTSKAGLQLLTLKKHSPVILFAAGVVGVVGAAVLASRATLKMEGILQEAATEAEAVEQWDPETYLEEKDRQKALLHIKVGTIVLIAKAYAPAVLVGAASIAALTGSHVILTQRNTALMAAYAGLDKAYKAYRKRVVDELGEDKDKQFQNGSRTRDIVEETPEGPVVTTVTEVDPNGYSVYAKFFDKFNRNWNEEWEYNRIFLQATQNHANNKLTAQGWLLLNDVYDALGIPRTKAGCVVGWRIDKDGDNYIDFGMFNKSKEMARHFVNGNEGTILLDFNVNGVVYDKIGEDCE